jgi:hypothetical protein
MVKNTNVINSTALFDPFMADLRDAVKSVPAGTASIMLYHSTGSSVEDVSGDTERDIKEVENEDVYPAAFLSIQSGRPMVEGLIISRARATTGRMMIAGTLILFGMLYDV